MPTGIPSLIHLVSPDAVYQIDHEFRGRTALKIRETASRKLQKRRHHKQRLHNKRCPRICCRHGGPWAQRLADLFDWGHPVLMFL